MAITFPNKALTLTSSQHLPEPGFFWIFLDCLQTSRSFSTGLPEAAWHDPVKSLTKVVCNTISIYSYVKENMEVIVKHTTLKIPNQYLERLFCRARPPVGQWLCMFEIFFTLYLK